MAQTTNYGFPILPDSISNDILGLELRKMIIGDGADSFSNLADAAIKEVSDQLGGYSIWVGTRAQYNALGTYSNTTLYFIKA